MVSVHAIFGEVEAVVLVVSGGGGVGSIMDDCVEVLD